jgi:hypothetical protein
MTPFLLIMSLTLKYTIRSVDHTRAVAMAVAGATIPGLSPLGSAAYGVNSLPQQQQQRQGRSPSPAHGAWMNNVKSSPTANRAGATGFSSNGGAQVSANNGQQLGGPVALVISESMSNGGHTGVGGPSTSTPSHGAMTTMAPSNTTSSSNTRAMNRASMRRTISSKRLIRIPSTGNALALSIAPPSTLTDGDASDGGSGSDTDSKLIITTQITTTTSATGPSLSSPSSAALRHYLRDREAQAVGVGVINGHNNNSNNAGASSTSTTSSTLVMLHMPPPMETVGEEDGKTLRSHPSSNGPPLVHSGDNTTSATPIGVISPRTDASIIIPSTMITTPATAATATASSSSINEAIKAITSIPLHSPHDAPDSDHGIPGRGGSSSGGRLADLPSLQHGGDSSPAAHHTPVSGMISGGIGDIAMTPSQSSPFLLPGRTLSPLPVITLPDAPNLISSNSSMLSASSASARADSLSLSPMTSERALIHHRLATTSFGVFTEARASSVSIVIPPLSSSSTLPNNNNSNTLIPTPIPHDQHHRAHSLSVASHSSNISH